MRSFALAVLLALVFVPAHAAPKVIGRTQPDVRVLKTGRAGTVPAPQAPAPGLDLAGPPPATTAPEAIALAKQLVERFGGRAALTAWIERGERRGTQSVYVPARVSATFVERRAPGKIRLDIETAGLAMSLADAPGGSWQRFLGLVSDLPQAQKDELARAQAHDEGLLLLAAAGTAPARIEGGALVVWGPSGSATRFEPGTDGPLDAIRFLERSAMRDETVPQALVFSDWRTLEPERTGRSGPAGARVPFRARHEVEGTLVEEDSLASVDLLAVIADSVFARPGASERTMGASRRAVLPLERRGEHHFARVSIDGGPPRTFLVDTGAGLTAISRELADTLGLALGGSMDIVGLGGGVEARSATLKSVGFGAIERRDVSCLVLDFAEMRQGMGLAVEGILGFSALNRYAVTFDFAQGAMEVVENGPRKAPGPGGARVPMETLGGQSLVEGKVDGIAAGSFILDTGSWITFVPADVGRKLATARRVPGVSFVGADGRVLEAEAVRARSLSIGAARVDRPIVLFATSGGVSDPVGLTLASGERGVLGGNVLRRFRVTLDYPRSELVLEPSAGRGPVEDGLDQFGLVGPGIVLRASADGLTVRHVVDGSPAARAGVRPGERVRAIDGHDVDGDSALAAQQRLSGRAGSRVRVKLETRTLELVRVALI
jgi:predicted aspartyl protease